MVTYDVEWDLEEIYKFHLKWVNRGALRKLAAKGYKREHHFSRNRMSMFDFNEFPDSYQLLVEIVLMMWVEGKAKVTSSGKQSKLIRDMIFSLFGKITRNKFQYMLPPTMVIVKAYDIISQLKRFGNRLFEDETEQAHNEKTLAHNERSRKLNRELLNLSMAIEDEYLDRLLGA